MRSLVLDAQIAVADQRGFLGFASRDRDTRVLDQGRRRALADGHAGRGGIEQADGLVRQLSGGNVAVREVDGCNDCGIGNANAVVLFHRAKEATQHHAAGLDIRFVDLDRLEASRERRVLLDVLAILRPGGSGDRAQRAAGERRFQEVGGIAGAGCAAGANQGMGFVDEQDDRGGRALHLVDHRAKALLELALHRRAGLHQADIEGAEPDIAQRRRHVAGGDALRESFDHRRLADAGFAGENRIVLPPSHQNVDQLADLFVATQDGIHLARFGLGCEILREPIERCRAFWTSA